MAGLTAQPVRSIHRRGRPAGFTLLEVIVAMVILSTSGLVLFAWINQNLQTARRLQESQARSQMQMEGVSWLATINPALEPEGERQIGDLHLTWRATPIEPMRPEFDFSGSLQPRWLLGLYRLEATIAREPGEVRAEWVQVVAGWRPLQSAPGPALGARW